VSDLTDVRYRTENWNVIQPMIRLPVVVVDEGDRIKTHFGIRQQLLGDHLAGRASADDDGADVISSASLLAVPGADAKEEARRDDEGARKETVDREDRKGDPIRR